MTLVEALRASAEDGRCYSRPHKHLELLVKAYPNDPEGIYRYMLTAEDILADDWECVEWETSRLHIPDVRYYPTTRFVRSSF